MRTTSVFTVLAALPLQSAHAASSKFTDVAYVANTCPATGYTTVEGCANEDNPPAPSIRRDLLWPVPRKTSGYPVPVDPNGYTSAGDRVALPALYPYPTEPLPPNRTTADGRLLLRALERSTMSFLPYRPENVQHDWRMGGTATRPVKHRDQLHPFVWLDPRNSRFSGGDTNYTGVGGPNDPDDPDIPFGIHSTICEDNGDASTAAPRRSPLPCAATYDGVRYDGDCYELTLIVNANLENPWIWEMRSVDLTVFVPGPKRPDTGSVLPDGLATLVYPRLPRPLAGDPWVLPEYRFKHINPLPPGRTPDQLGYDLARVRNLTADRQLCDAPTPASRPNWCWFFERQRRRTEYLFDIDEDAVRDATTSWDGGDQNNPGPFFLFEPTTTADGRLLVLNAKGVMYSYSSTPCDIRGWSKFYPISHMPQDPAVAARYPIARAQRKNNQPRPFRDSLGADVPFGKLDLAAYPWIDREGKNLFLSVGNQSTDAYRAFQIKNLSNGAVENYNPASPDRPKFNPDRGPGSRVAVLGAWTQGQLVVLDDSVNFVDFGRGRNDRGYNLHLYADADQWVSPKGSQLVGSFENRLYQYDAHNPTMPFDVVWMLTSDTLHNSEVVFDEYHNNHAFVVAHMNAATEWATGWAHDGFEAATPSANVRDGYIADFQFKRTPLLQNAATSSAWHAAGAVEGPATLRLLGGARVEPVAQGGVLGKGVYLDGANDFIEMTYTVDPTLREAPWYLGLWIDPRDTAATVVGAQRTVFNFPDGSTIALQRLGKGGLGGGDHRIVLRHAPTGQSRTIPLPHVVPEKFFHLGVKLDATFESVVGEEGTRAHRLVQLHVDGTPVGAPADFAVDSYKPGSGALGFQLMTTGPDGVARLTIGHPGPTLAPGLGRATLQAWVDELRIYALRRIDAANPWFDEFICNTALGTLVDVAGASSDPRVTRLQALAQKYPGKPTTICEQLVLESYGEPLDLAPRFGARLCADRTHRDPDPAAGQRCLRELRLGLDAAHRLAADVPRPKFTDVPFCTNCHAAGHPLKRTGANGSVIDGGLDLTALIVGATPRFQDPRRQPMNVPATIAGRLPSSWTPATVPPLLAPTNYVYTLDHVFDAHPHVAPNP